MANITTTAQFHKHVVNDVIEAMRAEFANEGLDEQVLEDLRQLWETKLIQAGAYDFPQAPQTYTYDQNFNYNAYLADPSPQVPTISNMMLPQTTTTSYLNNPYLATPPIQQQQQQTKRDAHTHAINALRSLNTQPTATTTQTTSHSLPPHSLPTLSNTLPTATSSHSLPTLSNTLPTLPNTILQQNTYGFDSSGKPQPYMAPPGSITGWNTQPTTNTQYNIPNIRQHDGANDEVDPVVAERQKIDKLLLKKFAKAQRQKQKSQTKEPTIPQFDGLGDRKTEDDDDDDDDDEADGSAKGDEELGSDLDDEDDDDEPDTEHIMLCQYEKVTRVKNKRKANLKDGIMHIGGKDYIFSKATGEFDW